MDNKKRHFLLLQGPVGFFFYSLAKSLRLSGAKASKIHFNAGDVCCWKLFDRHAKCYQRSRQNWEFYLRRFLSRNEDITDILLYGDCRPIHKTAIKIAKELGIKVTVFEEGYIRPNMITMEDDGVNANSPMLTNINKTVKEIEASKSFDAKESIKLKSVSTMQTVLTTIYYFICITGGIFFNRNNNHREMNLVTGGAIWIPRYISYRFRKYKYAKEILNILKSKRQYFIFAMQLTDDFQIKEHSQFSDVKKSLVYVIESFAKYANKRDLLVIKNHPLDNGHHSYSKKIRRVAERNNVSNRVVYLDGGRLLPLFRRAKGMIAVNSTANLQSIHHRIPTKTISTAVYNIEGLSDQRVLAEFWIDQKKPSQVFYKNFRKYLLKNNQFNGSFYTFKGINVLTPTITKKLLNGEE